MFALNQQQQQLVQTEAHEEVLFYSVLEKVVLTFQSVAEILN